MPHLAIVVDADACVPERIRSDLGIVTAPLDAPLLEHDELIVDLRRSLPPPDPGAVAVACRSATETSESVLYLSANGAGATEAANRAREALSGRARFRHHSTEGVLMASGWQAIAAALIARDGGDFDEACAAAEGVADRVELLAMLEHPELLNAGGALAGLRRRRAIVRLDGDDVEVVERLARREEALVSVRDRFAEAAGAGPHLRVAVLHAGAAAAADAMARWVQSALSPEEVVTAPLTRSAAARFGPGTIAFAWYRDSPS